MTGLDELIGRLEKATGPSREIDAAIFRRVAGSSRTHCYTFGSEYFTDATAPAITLSLDAAIALCERVLPGANVSVHLDIGHARPPYGKVRLTHHQIGDDDTEFVTEWMQTPALALCLAVCRALTAQKPGGG